MKSEKQSYLEEHSGITREAISNKLSIIIALWLLDKFVMTILFILFR